MHVLTRQKNVVIKASMALSLLFMNGMSAAQEKPPLHYENWGVCPFECCTYRDWTAEENIPVHRGRDEKSPVVFQLQKDEQVMALTGVVVTEKPIPVKINKTVKDGFIQKDEAPQLTLHSGDVVYFLTPLGEGYFKFWYRGNVYDSGDNLRAALPDHGVSTMTWWKLVRNSQGNMGWTRSDKFNNVDACG